MLISLYVGNRYASNKADRYDKFLNLINVKTFFESLIIQHYLSQTKKNYIYSSESNKFLKKKKKNYP